MGLKLMSAAAIFLSLACVQSANRHLRCLLMNGPYRATGRGICEVAA